MWTVSTRFLDAVRGPHKRVVVASVLDQGNPVPGFDNLPVAAGSVTRDRMAQIYAQANLTIPGFDYAPLTPFDRLAPVGYEIVIKVGVQYADGTTELVPVFVGPIQDATVDSLGTTSLSAADRSQWLLDGRFLADASLGSGAAPATIRTTLSAFVTQIIDWPISIDLESVAFETTTARLTWELGSTRWDVIVGMVDSAGGWVRFSGLGDLVGSPEPDLSKASPVWTINEYDADNPDEPGVLIQATTSWSRRPSFPGILAIGRNTEFDVTYKAFVLDNDPASPTYYYGRFSDKPGFVEAGEIQSTAQAQRVAAAKLLQTKGVARSLNLTFVPNYALEPGDVALVQRTVQGLDLPVVLDSITLDLGSGAMTADVRASQDSETEVS